MIEQAIYMKGCVLISLRGLMDEELFLEDNSTSSLPLLPQHGYKME